MIETTASTVWILGIVIWTIIRIPHRRRARNTAVAVDQKSIGERVALSLCIFGLVIAPAVSIATNWFAFADHTTSWIMVGAGTVSMAAFLLLFYYSHKHLARNWSVTLELREDHKLIERGLYRHIRHPMYTSFWLWGLAQALLIPNWVAGFIGLMSVAWLYFSRIDKEEAMMKAQFGAQYEAYCARTKRLIPGVI